MRWDGKRLRVEGWAFIGGVGAPKRDAQHVTLTALRPGRLAARAPADRACCARAPGRCTARTSRA